jgi:hypothetical protein
MAASSVFDAALCPRSISHNPHADEHDPSACGGQLLIVGLTYSRVDVIRPCLGNVSVVKYILQLQMPLVGRLYWLATP